MNLLPEIVRVFNRRSSRAKALASSSTRSYEHCASSGR